MLAGTDELIDDHLGAIGEIAELSFPEDQRVRFRLAEAIFETQHRRLG